LFSALSVLSITLIKPIFSIIFKTDVPLETTQNIGFLESIKNAFFDTMTNFVVGGDASLQATLIRFGLLVFAVFLLKNVVKYISSIVNATCEGKIVKNARDTIFSKLTSLSIDFFNKEKSGSLISVITNDVSAMNSNIIGAFAAVVRDSIQVILYIFLLFSISVRLTLVTFFAGAVILLAVRIATKYLKRYATRIQQAMANFTTTLNEIISGIRIVKAFNAEDNVNNRFNNDTQYYFKSNIKFQKVSQLVPIVSEMAAIISLCFVLLQGGMLILNEQLAASDLMLFLFAIFSTMAPILNVINCITSFQKGFAAADRVFAVLDKVPSVQDGALKTLAFNRTIQFKNVGFRYLENISVLNNFNLTINKGEQVAFVGASGSGKSTLLDLLIRFYDVTSGEILIDGVNIKEYEVKAYRSLFGIVSQENILFNDSVKNNIAFGYDDYTNEQLITAAKTSNCYDFIMRMENGFDTTLGDRGVNISGGERQRVAIARALLRNPNIIIFDEATSALDAESEKLVQGAINNTLNDGISSEQSPKTAVIVAHRLSTITHCDKIVVLDKGKVVEHGNHQELLARNGYYAKLWHLQVGDGDKHSINS
jgi:subfamily B ATP-binding cassette protein MsbA